MDLLQHVSSVFREKFKKTPVCTVAPGRINLIGEHTDYNDGFVMPAAIDRHLIFAMAPSGNDRSNIYAADFDEGVTFSIHDLNPGMTWVNYLMGMVDSFQRRGLAVKGVDCVFGGNIPAGSGLSSSAALCCGFGFAINQVFKLNASRLDIARMAQSTEREFAGANVGIMDQYASLFGKADTVLYLDCRQLTHKEIPFRLNEFGILLIDSNVKHSIAATAYNDRRAACEEGVHILQTGNRSIHALRDVSRDLLMQYKNKMSSEAFTKCLYVIDEIDRTRKAAGFLQTNDAQSFGALMYQTHWDLSRNYEVSCKELDVLVALAEENKNDVVGARLMGGGFGGCTINLIRHGKEESFKVLVRQKYFATFRKEPDFYQVKISEGVHTVDAS